VIHGTDDAIAPPAAAERLARGIPKASLHWVRPAGHLLLAEQPRALYDAATEFFSRGLE
jgi:pimeloyl-ACP methyl ester carboxylesterase